MSANEGKLDRGETLKSESNDRDGLREEKKKTIDKVITGNVKQKKKGFFKKMKEAICGEDTVSVGEYILYDVLIPSAKDLVRDMIFGGVEMRLYGGRKGGQASYRDGKRSYVSYSSCHNGGNRDTNRREMSRASRAGHNFKDIVLDTRGEADDVLHNLVDLCIDYGQASVADLYDLIGIDSGFTDNRFGWTDLHSASVSRVRDGYLLNLPRTQPLD